MPANKKADSLFNIDPLVAARYGLGGALAGGSAAGLLSLVQALRESRRAEQEEETDENTIVLRLPPKTAADTTKEANWQTLTAALLAGGAGAAGGYTLVDKLVQDRRQAALDEELEAAKQEYLDMLMNPKTAFAQLFHLGAGTEPEELEKTAENTFHALDYPLGLGALAFILGSGGTAYLTKQVLDEMDRSQGNLKPQGLLGKGQPRLSKLVIRSGQPDAMPLEEEEEKLSSDQAHNQLLVGAALGVQYDVMGGEAKILNCEKVSAELTKAGSSADELYKAAANGGHWLVSLLDSLPESVSHSIQHRLANTSGAYKSLSWIPGMKAVGRFAVKRKIRNSVPQPSSMLNLFKGSEAVPVVEDPEKLASVIGSVMTSFFGSSLAEGQGAHSPQTPDVTVSGEGQEPPPPEEIVERLKVVAEGDQAESFVADNSAALHQTLLEMAGKGQLGQ